MKHIVAALTGFALASLVFFCVIISYQTLVDAPPPIELIDGAHRAYPEGDDTLFFYERQTVAKSDAHYTLERTIECDYVGSKYLFDLPPVMREVKAGEQRSLHRVVVFPFRVEKGTECKLESTVYWTPAFSMLYHSVRLPDIDFVVGEHTP